MDAIKSEMRRQIIMNFYRQNSFEETHFRMDRQMDRQTQRPIEMQGHFTITQFQKKESSKLWYTMYKLTTESSLISSGQSRRILLKTANDNNYTTFKWINAYLMISVACLGVLALLTNILLQFD